MKFKAVIAAGIAVLTLAVGFGAQTSVTSAAPPDLDHEFSVVFSTTALNSNPDITQQLGLCTDQDGDPEPGGGCAAAPGAAPFFDQATAMYQGISNGSGTVAVASRVGTVSFDIETNGGTIAGAGPNAGQPNECGAVAHVSPAAFTIYNGVKTGATVSMDPSGTPGFGLDQIDDPAQPNSGAPQGDGWPTGVGTLPIVVPTIQALAGIPAAALIGRGYGVAIVAAGVSQTTVSFLTVATSGNPGVDPIASITVLGNPFGAASPTGANTANCPPFYSEVTQLGVSLGSAGSTTILGGAAPAYTPAAPGGQTLLTICSGSCSTRNYSILLSSGNDDDNDGDVNADDNCPTVVNPGDVGFAGIGLACDLGQGYDNNSGAALAALAGCGLPATCADLDTDGFLNASDNCPFVANPTQLNADSDGRGNACEGNGTDPLSGAKNNPAAAVDGDGSGLADDEDDNCVGSWSVGGPLTATVACLRHGAGDAHPGGALTWNDSNDDGVPDFLVTGATTVARDHKADSNSDGYSDADQGQAAGNNCAPVSPCSARITLGTAETGTCAALCAGQLNLARNTASGPGTGCLKTLDESVGPTTINLAKSDVDLDGAVSILDLAKVAGWFGNSVGNGTDPRNEGNFDIDTAISILDLSAMAGNFGRNVAGTCAIL